MAHFPDDMENRRVFIWASGMTDWGRDPDIWPPLVERVSSANGKSAVLCIGCATGEEPYTLALRCMESNYPPTVTALDIRADALSVAKAGQYPAAMVRNAHGLSESEKRNGFTYSGHVASVSAAASKCVEFKRADFLRMDSGRYDIVMMRNVLHMLPADNVNAAIERVIALLNPDGFLALGESDFRVPALASAIESATVRYGHRLIRKPA